MSRHNIREHLHELHGHLHQLHEHIAERASQHSRDLEMRRHAADFGMQPSPPASGQQHGA